MIEVFFLLICWVMILPNGAVACHCEGEQAPAMSITTGPPPEREVSPLTEFQAR